MKQIQNPDTGAAILQLWFFSHQSPPGPPAFLASTRPCLWGPACWLSLRQEEMDRSGKRRESRGKKTNETEEISADVQRWHQRECHCVCVCVCVWESTYDQDVVQFMDTVNLHKQLIYDGVAGSVAATFWAVTLLHDSIDLIEDKNVEATVVTELLSRETSDCKL